MRGLGGPLTPVLQQLTSKRHHIVIMCVDSTSDGCQYEVVLIRDLFAYMCPLSVHVVFCAPQPQFHVIFHYWRRWKRSL